MQTITQPKIPKINFKRLLRQYQAVFILVAPALIGLMIFQLWPIFQALRVSFYNYNLVAGTMEWRGLQNYISALQDPIFWRTIRNTFLFFILKVPLQMIFGLGLALLVRQTFRGVGVLRTLIMIPTITSMVVVSVIWGLMYHPTNGLINGLLETVNLPAQPFLISAKQSMASIALMTIWKDVGLNMIFFLAGLMGIPESLYEAAKIDGAGSFQLFRHITLPSLNRTTVFVAVTNTITAFKVFTPIYLMTRGGPAGSTRVVVLYIYENAFIYNKMGYAAAISVILALVLLVISVISTSRSSDG